MKFIDVQHDSLTDRALNKENTKGDVVLSVTNSILSKRWMFAGYDERLAAGISQSYGLPELVGRVLASRGIAFDHVPHFLDPTLKTQLPDPGVLKDMDKAAARIASAIMHGEKVAVFGDYDVDGATSSALLKRFFRAAGSDIRIYIPDRLKEGYGPNASALLKLKEEGIELVITVDCGVTAFEPLAEARKAGLEVIVFDHHEAEPHLPEATSVVNPNRFDEDRSLGNLAACGVTFLAIVAINRVLRASGWYGAKRAEPRLTDLLDLVALGTVCDVVPLTGVNRAFVAQGLKVMALRQNIGLTALCDVAGVNDMPSAYHAGFVLGPRVNAGGRVGESWLGAELLSTEDPVRARQIAEHLNDLNRERQAIEMAVVEQAIEQVEEKGLHKRLVILASNPGWHPGVIGIVAARLKEKYNRPCCVIGFDDNGIGKASGRSVSGVDLGAAVIAARQKGLLINGGGHKMAAGFTVAASDLAALDDYLNEHVAAQLNGEPLVPELRVDGVVSPMALNISLVEKIGMMAPFGSGNSEPRFVLPDVRVAKSSVVGENHVKCFVQDTGGGASVKAVAFRALGTPLGDLLMQRGGAPVHLLGHARINNWMGRTNVDFQIEDAAPVFEK